MNNKFKILLVIIMMINASKKIVAMFNDVCYQLLLIRHECKRIHHCIVMCSLIQIRC
jgi:hypothetical protein